MNPTADYPGWARAKDEDVARALGACPADSFVMVQRDGRASTDVRVDVVSLTELPSQLRAQLVTADIFTRWVLTFDHVAGGRILAFDLAPRDRPKA